MDQIERPRRGWWLSGRFTPRQIDLAVVVIAFVTSFPEAWHGNSHAIGFAMIPIGALALLWRRTHPGVTLAVVAAAFMIGSIFGGRALPGSAFVFAVYAASMYGSRRVRFIAAGLAVAAMIIAFSTVLATGEAKRLGHLAGVSFGSGIGWALADRNRNRRAYLDQLEDRARNVEREKEENRRRAVEEERNRIARDLHEVVAHNVSLIAVQAGAARTTSTNALETLGLIERTARGTLSELRALLGVLRKDEKVPLHPQPTLEQLDGLVRHARDAGIGVETTIAGAVRPLPQVVDLCAYRVVQEALTNVIKHAPGATATVMIRYESERLAIDVVDDGPGANGTESGGHGLLGMKERVGLLGGRMEAGTKSSGGGFRVDVRIPLEPE